MSADPTQLQALVANGTVRMRWAPEIMDCPAPFAGTIVDSDRVRGMLLGLAIGDALGNTSEAMVPRERRALVGEIRDYRPNRHAGSRGVGLPSDDTQLAFWIVEHLLEHGSIQPDALARTFSSRHIFGIGRTMRAFVRAWHGRQDWRQAAQASAGNGALMRIAPVLLPHLKSGSAGLWADAALGTAVTHNDPAAISSSIAFVGLLAELISSESVPETDWWVCRYVELSRPVEGEVGRCTVS
jgi:ADP-ribosylglycohydrolase